MWDQLKKNYSVCVHGNEETCGSFMRFYQFLENNGGLRHRGGNQLDQLIVGFGISVGFVDVKKYTEYHQTYSSSCVEMKI